MLIIKTSAVEVSIHATSPLFGCGAGAAVASAFFSSALTDSVTVAAFASAFVASVAVVGGAAGLSCATVGAISPRTLTSPSNAKTLFMASPLQRLRADFAGADADDLLEVEYEDLPVADLAGVRRLLDRLDHLLEHVAFDRGFDLDLRQEVDHVLGPTVELRVALLPPEALDLGDRNPLHADARQRLAHLVELERLDDGGNEFHRNPLPMSALWNGGTLRSTATVRTSCRPRARARRSRRREPCLRRSPRTSISCRHRCRQDSRRAASQPGRTSPRPCSRNSPSRCS